MILTIPNPQAGRVYDRLLGMLNMILTILGIRNVGPIISLLGMLNMILTIPK
mgnify:CR=1 FL=1